MKFHHFSLLVKSHYDLFILIYINTALQMCIDTDSWFIIISYMYIYKVAVFIAGWIASHLAVIRTIFSKKSQGLQSQHDA